MKHMMLAVACAAMLTAPALGDWSENFETYDLSSGICGQGGWTGWDGATFADAIIASDPAGSGGKVLQEANGNDIVHEYAGYTSGAWVYRAKQYIPSSQHGTGGTSLILMNNYTPAAKGWGVSLNLDLNADTVNDGEAVAGGLPIQYDQWVDIRVEIDLDANLRATYYNNTFVGLARWYVPGDLAHAKSVAAVDLWANENAARVVYYDDLSLTPGSPLAQGTDLTTYPGREARYMVNMGRAFAETIVLGPARPSGLYDFTCAGGNQQAWWRLNNGEVGGVMVTYGAPNPDYFGYKFKVPATIKQIAWWNYPFGDGGTFAAAPAVEYLDAVDGTWHTITDVTWNKPYNNDYTTGWVRSYIITLNNPPHAVWGIRLIGDAQPGADDDGNGDVGGTGFIGVTELTLYGNLELGSLDLTNNLAPSGTPIANYWEVPANAGAIIDGSTGDTWGPTGTYATTYHPNERDKFSGEDWIGIQWSTPQDHVAAFGWTCYANREGGMFNPCHDLRVQVATDPGLTNWQTVTGLDLGRYPADWLYIRQCSWTPHTAWLFRFDEVSGIYGIRLIGDPDSANGADLDGWIGTWEVEVFANAGGAASAAKPAKPTLASRIVESVKQAWSRVAL